jgi:hypothetical protein
VVPRVTDVIGPAIDDRLHMVAGVPPVLAAIGALGHPLVNSNDGDRQVRKAHALAKLKPVRWEKGDRWVGLCGKKTPKGRFSVGGPKEYAHLAYTALAQEESENYIRGKRAANGRQARSTHRAGRSSSGRAFMSAQRCQARAVVPRRNSTQTRPGRQALI